MTIACTPADISTRDHFWSSPFENYECESILRNAVLLQKHLNPAGWTPFSWDEYVSFCGHRVALVEKQILDVFVTGGTAPRSSSHTQITPGWLAFDGERYSFTPKTIEMLLEKYAQQ